jgi:parvulin-like peptidyl-prolyl isomerase
LISFIYAYFLDSAIKFLEGIVLEDKPEHHEHHEHSEEHHVEHHAHNVPKAAVHKHHVPTHRKDIHFGKPKRTPWKRYIIGALGFIILLAIVVTIIIFISHMGGKRVAGAGDVAATVNGEKITVGYLDEQYSRVPETYKPFITKSMLLNQTINEFILLQEAKKQGIEVTKEDVQAEIETAMTRAGVTDEQLDERLAAQNITRVFLEDLYMKQLTITKLLEKTIFTKIKITDADVEEFYNSRVRAAHILVDTEEEANSIIESLKKFSQAKIESEFSKLAKAKSKDPSAQENGGDLGEFGKGQMVAPFEQAAFALEEYSFTAEPVKTQFGYHVILRLPKNATLEEQSASINEFLLSQKKAAAVPLYVEQLRNKAVIEVLYKEEPAAVEPELAVQPIVSAEPATE